MIIREPLVNATYYYLREAPGDSPARRTDRHDAFVADARRLWGLIAGWLALSAPALPPIPPWEAEPPADPQPLMQTGELQGRFNASAWLHAYALRNMLLLRVVLARGGEHEHSVWTMLDDALGEPPATPSWLHTARYWCGVAPRPPEDLEQERPQPVKTPFGVWCLGGDTMAHVLVYPDARTQARANAFLGSLAVRLDWYPVQARHRAGQYADHASSAARKQQALDQAVRSAQLWTAPAGPHLRALAPLEIGLETIEAAYGEVLADLSATRSAAQDLRALVTDYRLTLMQSGLWDAAPTVWEARVDALASLHAQIEADVQYIDSALRRMELVIGMLQTRVALLQSERQRALIYVVTLIGLAILAVLIADSNLTRVAIRLVVLLIVAALVWGAWRWRRPGQRGA